jgi:hypothetical protein
MPATDRRAETSLPPVLPRGRWRADVATYVKAVRRYATEIGNLGWAATA